MIKKLPVMEKKVRQSNEFVEAPYIVEFTLHEIKIMEYLIADCKEEDYQLIGKKQGKEFTFSASQMAKILNTSVSRVAADGDKLANDITSKRIIHKDYDADGKIEGFLYLSIINDAIYKDGKFYFELNYKALPFFVNVNKNFTEFQLKHLLAMNTTYAVKLYKILYQYKNIGKRRFKLSDLKIQFGIGDKYQRYGHFKNRILDPSIKQINKITDIQVVYNEIMDGRQVNELDFIIKSQPQLLNLENDIKGEPDSTPIELNFIIQSLDGLISTTTKEMLVNYYYSHGINYIEGSVAYARKNAVNNFDKYLQDTLNNHYAEITINNVELTKKNIEAQEIHHKIKITELNNNKQQLLEQTLDQYNQLSIKEQTDNTAELFQKISSICPDKLPDIIDKQQDYVIAYFACKRGLFYNGNMQMLLKAWQVI
jgi:hypothetical protein